MKAVDVLLNDTKQSASSLEGVTFRGRQGPSRVELMAGITAILIPLILGVIIVRYVVDVPIWDEWSWAPLFFGLHDHTLTFQDLWATHNQHRMFFGKLIAVGLVSLGGWSEVRECLASLVIAIVGQLFLFRLLRATLPNRSSYLLLILDSLLLFALSQSGNWNWGFQTAWFLINTAVIATLWFLRKSPVGVGAFIAAAAFACVASFSSAFGLNVWPAALVVLILSAKPNWRQVSLWVVFAFVAVALYLYQYVPPENAGASGANRSVFLLASYFLSYLGGPLGVWGGVPVASTVGAAALLGYVVAFSVAVNPKTPRVLRENMAPWIGLGAFAVLSAVMTTSGRAGLGSEQALSARYITPASMLWIALLSLGALSEPLIRSRALFKSACAICLVVGGVLFTLASFHGLSDLRDAHDQNLVLYDTARRFRVEDDEDLRKLYPAPVEVRSFLMRLSSTGIWPVR